MNTNIKINDLIKEAEVIRNRLVDSDFHESDAAVPPVAEDAAKIIGQLLDAIAKSALNPEVVRKIAENIAINDYLCDPSDDTTFESLGASLKLNDAFPADVTVWEPFESYGHETVLGYMEGLAAGIEYGINNAIFDNFAQNTSKVAVGHWKSYSGHDFPSEKRPFLMEITDQRAVNGQMYVDIAPESGNLDDIMSLCLEINCLPGDETDRQCAHLCFDGDSLAVSIFKDGDGYIVRPETNVGIQNVRLANSEMAWRIQSV